MHCHWHSQYAQTRLRPAYSGQIGWRPRARRTAERPAATGVEARRQGGAQLLTCEDASGADCDDGGPSSDYSICPNGPDCHDCGPRQPLRFPTSSRAPSCPAAPRPRTYPMDTNRLYRALTTGTRTELKPNGTDADWGQGTFRSVNMSVHERSPRPAHMLCSDLIA
jgi:hypothetical protein